MIGINANLRILTENTKNKLSDPEIKKIFSKTKSYFESVLKKSKKVSLKTKEIMNKLYAIPGVIGSEPENGASKTCDKEKEM